MFHKIIKSRNKAPLEPWTIYQFNLFLFHYVFLQIMYHKDKADKTCIQKDFFMQLICKYVNNYILKLQVYMAKILPALHTNCIQATVAFHLQKLTHPKIWSLFNAEKKNVSCAKYIHIAGSYNTPCFHWEKYSSPWWFAITSNRKY